MMASSRSSNPDIGDPDVGNNAAPVAAVVRTKADNGPLRGDVALPGDKSISHRALILATLATGTSTITGLLEGDDVLATARAMQALGATVERLGDGHWQIIGCGTGGLETPDSDLDFGNSGTGVRLVMGLVAGAGIKARFTGDRSLSARPMARVTDPLAQMGAQICGNDNGKKTCTLPLTIIAPAMAMPIDYQLPVASAQVKSAILLAGLNAPGTTIIREKPMTRDHSENMLHLFGAKLDRRHENGTHIVTLQGEGKLRATQIDVPGDSSSAAFPLVAALCVPGSDIVLRNIMVNPQRDGLIRVLKQMGGQIVLCNEHMQAGETIVDLHVRHSPLHAVEVPADLAPSMIDEYPALAVAAAYAHGTTRMYGLHELRLKESDRLAAIAAGLAANGVTVEEGADTLVIEGGPVVGGGLVATHHDHRIAMAFLTLGLSAKHPVSIDDATMINTSFPNFFALMGELGANFDHADEDQ